MTSPETLPPTPRRARPRGAPRARGGTVRGPGSAVGFAVRLCLAIGATVALLGVAGYLMIGDQLDRRLLQTYAAEHRADARTLADAQRPLGPRAAHREVAQLLSAIARRPGVIEARLVGPDHVVEQAGDPGAVGRADSDPRVDAALRRGRSYAGRRAGTGERNFDFVLPVRVAGGRQAFAVTRDQAL